MRHFKRCLPRLTESSAALLGGGLAAGTVWDSRLCVGFGTAVPASLEAQCLLLMHTVPARTKERFVICLALWNKL